jgi:hypothetical protein
MVAVFRDEPHFAVPLRARVSGLSHDSNQARLELAGRIAELPGIHTVDNSPESLPSSVTVFLDGDHVPARKRTPPRTLCVISRDGLCVHGLSLRDRRHLASQGWGTLAQERVQIYMPRNEDEVDVCWTILRHAHCSLLNISARAPGSRHAFYRELPRFSRTTL